MSEKPTSSWRLRAATSTGLAGCRIAHCLFHRWQVGTVQKAQRGPQEAEMLRTVEVMVAKDGTVTPLEPLTVQMPTRALLTLLEPDFEQADTAGLAAPALAVDWLRPEEDLAWAHLQSAK